jgi:HlyD family secretion protein
MYQRLRNGLIVGMLLILAASFLRFRMDQGEPVLAFLETGGGGEADVTFEDVTTVQRGDIRVTIGATGSINPNERLLMFFALPGTVQKIHVEEGDTVQAGDLLASLQTDDLALAIEEAGLALELQQVSFEALTADPREADLAAAQAAVYSAGWQLESSREVQNPEQERLALLQLEIARNQLWQSQMQRDSVVDQQEFFEELGIAPPNLPGLTTSPTQAEAGVERAEYDVAIAEQQVAQAQDAGPNAANVAAAQAALASAQSNLDRLQNGPSETEIAIADAQLQTAFLAVELARYQLEQATLSAPFDGVVARINLTEGEPPPTNNASVELIDNSSYVIDLAVDEIDIAQIAVGQMVEITLDALPNEIVTGRVSLIDTVATDLGGLITYRVRVVLDPADVPIRVGMSATATIIADEVFDVLRLSNRFIRLDRMTQQAFVTVQQADGSLQEVQVVLGRRNETYSEIVEGLQVGDTVVLLPRSFLSEFGF